MWIKLSEWEMIFNDIKWYPGVRLGGYCTAWLRVLDFVLRQKALEVFLVSNGILTCVTFACYMDEAVDDAVDMMQSCPLSQWCHPTISSSVIPLSSCLQCFPDSESFPMSQFFASGGQSIGSPASASVLPRNIQDWSFRMDWLDLLAAQGTSQESSPTQQFKSINFFDSQLSL